MQVMHQDTTTTAHRIKTIHTEKSKTEKKTQAVLEISQHTQYTKDSKVEDVHLPMNSTKSNFILKFIWKLCVITRYVLR